MQDLRSRVLTRRTTRFLVIALTLIACALIGFFVPRCVNPGVPMPAPVTPITPTETVTWTRVPTIATPTLTPRVDSTSTPTFTATPTATFMPVTPTASASPSFTPTESPALTLTATPTVTNIPTLSPGRRTLPTTGGPPDNGIVILLIVGAALFVAGAYLIAGHDNETW